MLVAGSRQTDLNQVVGTNSRRAGVPSRSADIGIDENVVRGGCRVRVVVSIGDRRVGVRLEYLAGPDRSTAGAFISRSGSSACATIRSPKPELVRVLSTSAQTFPLPVYASPAFSSTCPRSRRQFPVSRQLPGLFRTLVRGRRLETEQAILGKTRTWVFQLIPR